MFIRNLALGVGAACLPYSSRAGSGSAVVLGAGLAGLYAARLLESAGWQVTVLESRSRVGGRINTLDQVPGHPEGGGNVIGPNYGRVIGTARELGVKLVSPERVPGGTGIVIDGQRVERDSWPLSDFNSLPEALRSITPDRLGNALLRDNPLGKSWAWREVEHGQNDRSAADYYRTLGLDEQALSWIDANNSYGNRLDDTSLISLYRVHANITRAIAMRQPLFEVSGGNARLPEAMAASLRGALHLSDPVASIEQGRQGVRVVCESGRVHEADAVICTLPLPALQNLEVQPGLPDVQAQAIASVDYHKVTQAHLLAHRPFWRDHDLPPGWWTNGPLGRVFVSAAGNDQYNMTCWINGDDCDRWDALPTVEAKAGLLQAFHDLLPESIGVVSVEAVVSWRNDPWAGGSWAIWRPGQAGQVADVLQQPHGRIHFAGEHTSWSNSGMEGAMESGERAALEVLRSLS